MGRFFIVVSEQKQTKRQVADSINNTARRANAVWFCSETTIFSGSLKLDLDKVILYSIIQSYLMPQEKRNKMQQVNIFQAKQTFSALIEQIESGQESEIIIARNNKPVARIMPFIQREKFPLGIAKGKFEIPDDIDKHNDEIAEMFETL